MSELTLSLGSRSHSLHFLSFRVKTLEIVTHWKYYRQRLSIFDPLKRVFLINFTSSKNKIKTNLQKLELLRSIGLALIGAKKQGCNEKYLFDERLGNYTDAISDMQKKNQAKLRFIVRNHKKSNLRSKNLTWKIFHLLQEDILESVIFDDFGNEDVARLSSLTGSASGANLSEKSN